MHIELTQSIWHTMTTLQMFCFPVTCTVTLEMLWFTALAVCWTKLTQAFDNFVKLYWWLFSHQANQNKNCERQSFNWKTWHSDIHLCAKSFSWKTWHRGVYHSSGWNMVCIGCNFFTLTFLLFNCLARRLNFLLGYSHGKIKMAVQNQW